MYRQQCPMTSSSCVPHNLRAGRILVTALEVLDVISRLLWPVMPATTDATRLQLGVSPLAPAIGTDLWASALPDRQTGEVVGTPKPPFPRIDAARKADIVRGLGMTDAEPRATAGEPRLPEGGE